MSHINFRVKHRQIKHPLIAFGLTIAAASCLVAGWMGSLDAATVLMVAAFSVAIALNVVAVLVFGGDTLLKWTGRVGFILEGLDEDGDYVREVIIDSASFLRRAS